jgi:hypothetical protein
VFPDLTGVVVHESPPKRLGLTSRGTAGMQYFCPAARPHADGEAFVICEVVVGLPARSRSAGGGLQQGLADISALLFLGLAMKANSDLGLRDGGWDLCGYRRLAGCQCLSRLRRPSGT